MSALRLRAEDISKRLKAGKIELEPVVTEFAGSPKSGKTTNIDIVAHLFKRTGFKVLAPTEGASKRTPSVLKRDFVAFNSWSLAYAIQELLVGFYDVDKNDLVILDRGPFDSLAWMRVLKDRGKLVDNNYDIIEAFALHEMWRDKIKRVYLFTCSTKKSLDREHESKLIKREGSAMNEPMLRELLEKYKELDTELDDYPVVTIDTTETSGPLSTAYVIADDICNIFENSIEGS